MLIYLAAAWAIGIAIASIVPLPLAVWVWWLILPVGLFLIWRHYLVLRTAHLCLLVFLLSAIRYVIALPPSEWQPTDLAFYNDHGTMLMIGNVVDPPDVRDRTTQVRLAVTRVRVDNREAWHDVSGLALLQAPRETDVRYGDQLQVFGEPTTPPVLEDFSYKDYLARQGIHSLVRVYGGVKTLARDQGNPFFAALYAFRDRGVAIIYEIFPDPSASLLAGILLGVDSGIPRAVTDAFSATNTAHIVAISGFNISIVAGILAALAKRVVGERRATIFVIVGLVAYTLLVGASASVVRAAIMGSVSVIAVHYHRQNDATNALSAAALLMLVLNPFTLFDMGFQLSFLATLGLILYVTPLTEFFERFFARLTSSERAKQIVGVLNDSFIVTFAAQMTTTAWIVFSFHRLSLIGLLTNFLVLPVQPAVEIWGGIATIAGLIFQPLGQVLAWIAYPFLEYTILVVQWTASLPFSAIDVGHLDVLILVTYYLLLFGLTFLRPIASSQPTTQVREASQAEPSAGRKIPVSILIGIALIAGVWLWNVALTLPDGKTHVEFLDAGNAATFVRTPNGARVLIDGGANPSVVVSALGRGMPFWDRKIDLLVLTDTSDDHLAGMIDVLERYDVRQIVQVSVTKQTAAYKRWNDLIAQKNVASIPAQAGTEVELDRGVQLEIVYPTQDARPAVVRLRVGGDSFLFADSAAADDQSQLVSDDIASTVLIAPRKISAEFFDAVNPQYAILFVGSGVRDQPSADLLATFANVTLLRTDERGTIEMIVDGSGLIVR